MSARLSVAPAPLDAAPATPHLTDLHGIVARAGIVSGVDERALSELLPQLAEPTFEAHDLLIAQGSPPEDGYPGWVELAFDTGLTAGTIASDGHMDFFDRGLLKSVEQGGVVAHLHEPGAGRAGFTVEGQPLSARGGPPSKLQLGSGLFVDEQGDVRAKSAGVVLHRGGELLDVVTQHVHNGSVDLHSGHLDMQGSLTVKGDVERLLHASATGDLEVLGSVSAGSVRAGGNVCVSGSVRGGDDGKIIAEADVVIRACESASVTARGTLRVRESVNSELSARHVVVSGRLRGGKATAELSVQVKEAGTPSGASTELCAGEPVELPDLDHVQRAVTMQKLRRMAERGGVRDAFGNRGDARGKGGKVGRLAAALSGEALAHKAELAGRRHELCKLAFLEVAIAHPGVELRIGSARVVVEQRVVGLRYALNPETGQLTVGRIAT